MRLYWAYCGASWRLVTGSRNAAAGRRRRRHCWRCAGGAIARFKKRLWAISFDFSSLAQAHRINHGYARRRLGQQVLSCVSPSLSPATQPKGGSAMQHTAVGRRGGCWLPPSAHPRHARRLRLGGAQASLSTLPAALIARRGLAVALEGSLVKLGLSGPLLHLAGEALAAVGGADSLPACSEYHWGATTRPAEPTVGCSRWPPPRRRRWGRLLRLPRCKQHSTDGAPASPLPPRPCCSVATDGPTGRRCRAVAAAGAGARRGGVADGRLARLPRRRQ